ncbi:hypothetical protein [Cupriavidus sp. TMH.W2]|uniref:hypothetical protein n=1 Tax=Cupriavidus sp. TMH.W2 TaxID=3434465 RepID=UPI003D76AB00
MQTRGQPEAGSEAALAYLSVALGHPVHAHWTLARVRRRCVSLAEAKAAPPAVLKLLLAHDGTIEYWERGPLRTGRPARRRC